MRLSAWCGAYLVGGVVLLSACGSETLEPLPSKFQSVVAGGVHSCGILTDGAAYCWGNNDFGQLGDGSRKSHVYAVPVVGAIRYTSLTGGAGHTCGIATTGAAYCWGFNLNGQLGDGTHTDRATPAPVEGGKSWISLSAGGAYTCGIATDSLAYCWGWNATGQLGDGTSLDRASPTAVSGALKFRSVKTNASHTCALTSGGQAYCWGENQFGQLGTGDAEASSTPVVVTGGLAWASVEAGFSHSCGIAVGGDAFCWGRNQYGQLGAGDSVGPDGATSPFPVAGGMAWASLDLGAYFGCGVEAQSAVAFCWGYNGSGQLAADLPNSTCVEEGAFPTQCALTPVEASGGLTFASVSAHTQHACGLSTDGTAYCWGRGSDGQLGDGRKGEQILTTQPVQVAGQP